MSTVLLCDQSAVATAADAHTDSGGLHITVHLHTVHDTTSQQWCVGRVMERETLSNNPEYQERLSEGLIKGSVGTCAKESLKDNLVALSLQNRQLQQQVSVDTINIVGCSD